MEDLEKKLSSMLANPQLMAQVQALAGSLGQTEQKEEAPASSPAPELSPEALKMMGQMLGSGTVDKEQQALLQALSPYIGAQRLGRLQKAMGAARMVSAARTLFTSGR